jgi:single-stranded DNA-binding protein
MSHDYKNYAHLEGVLDDDPVVSPTSGGFIVTFKLSVREQKRGDDGKVIKRTHLFEVEVGKDNSRYAAALRKGTPVWIDARIRIRTVNLHGFEQEKYILDAHRVYAIDYSVGKRGVDLINDFLNGPESDIKE